MPSSTRPLPPGQELAAPDKWPIVGERVPASDDAPWTLTIAGCVTQSRTWTLDELRSRGQVRRLVDVHCVTRWSKLDMVFEGLPLASLVAACSPTSEARFAIFEARSTRRHSTSLPLDAALQLDALVALSWDDRPLPSEHGGPVRMVIPGRYFYKSVKWLTRIELTAADRLGYWESQAGHHNSADPWLQQRFLAPDLDRRAAAALLASRDLSHRTLRGLDASDHALTAIVARGAVLRDADFSRCQLAGADFSHANLSNARFRRAVLRDAQFRDADVEGADFCGADVRGVDFRGASLLGVTFTDDERTDPRLVALADSCTQFSAAQVEQLAPPQRDWLERSLARTG